MNVNRDGNSNLLIEATPDEAGLLLNLLSVVSDLTETEPLDRMFNRLMDLHVTPVGNVTVEENPLHDEYDDEPGFLVVVED